MLLILLIAAVLLVANPPLNSHAVERHPGLAQRIHDCLEDGPEMTFKDKSGRHFFCVEMPDGKWGFKIAEKVGGKWHTITAYYKGDGSLKTLLDYFTRNGITRVLP